jgi:hypothetical protein
LKAGKRVVGLDSWDLGVGIEPAGSPEEAVDRALS